MTEEKKCILCGAEDFEPLFSCEDFLLSHEEFKIVRCKNCGLIKTDSPPPEKAIGRYYLSEDYISHSDSKKGITEQAYHFARNIMLRRKWRLISHLFGQKKGYLLDIGSGTGYFPAFMQKKGWAVRGIEISEQARNFSASKFGIDVISPVDSGSLSPGSYDCITLWHVLEHFNDPVYWLEEIKNLLKDDGFCIIAVPNASSSDAKWFGQYWAAYDVPRHLWHYTPHSLTAIATLNGFTLIKKKNMPLDVFYISILSYKHKKSTLPVIKGLITGVFLSFKNLLKRDCGSSVIYILKKTS
jgi:2-polyprenyl-3-methyl-5-hydroxy-6-metoxy-1,4-benzoquinol methylase